MSLGNSFLKNKNPGARERERQQKKRRKNHFPTTRIGNERTFLLQQRTACSGRGLRREMAHILSRGMLKNN